MRFKMLASSAHSHSALSLAITLVVRRRSFSVLASSCWVQACRVAHKIVCLTTSYPAQEIIVDPCRWYVHRCARHHRVRPWLQHHRCAHFDHGARVSDSEGTHGQYLQLAVESWRDC